MAFLTQEELKTKSTAEIITLITGGDDSIVTDIIEECTDIMKDYLFKYYDTEVIFTNEGAERSKTVLRHLKSLVIREIYARRSKLINKVAQDNYNEAMNWLEKVASGKIEVDLPSKKIDTNGDGVVDSSTGFFKFGSSKKYSNRF